MELVAFAFWLFLGISTAMVASSKGRSGFGWCILGLFLGPLGLILALVVAPIQDNLEHKALHARTTKKCPFCAELIRVEAVVCRFCGRPVQSSSLTGMTITHPKTGRDSTSSQDTT